MPRCCTRNERISCAHAYKHSPEWDIVDRLYKLLSAAANMCDKATDAAIQGVVTYASAVEAFATGIKMESSDQGLFRRRSKDQGLFRRRSRDQGGLRATISTIKYWLFLANTPILTQAGWHSFVPRPFFSPNSGANNGLGTRLVSDFSRPRLPYGLRRARPLRPRLGRLSLTGARICIYIYRLLRTSGFTNGYIFFFIL